MAIVTPREWVPVVPIVDRRNGELAGGILDLGRHVSDHHLADECGQSKTARAGSIGDHGERAGAVYCLAMRWDWQAIGTIVAIAAVAVTLIFNLLSQQQTRAGQQQDREMFEATAQRSEAAARLTERYTQRVVDALEAMAQSGIGGGQARLPKVAWSMEHHVGDTYRLTNIGDAKAWNVILTSDKTLRLLNVTGGPDLGEGEALTFMASVHMGTRDRTISVTWNSDSQGTSGGTWRYPLPARPPR
jgi:hypothetical protein